MINVFILIEKLIEDDLAQQKNTYNQYASTQLYEKVPGRMHTQK